MQAVELDAGRALGQQRQERSISDLNDLRDVVLEGESAPQPNLVQAILSADVEEPPELEAGLSSLAVGDAPPERGGWGATVVVLRSRPSA